MSTSFDIEISAELLAQAQSGRASAQADIYQKFEKPAYTLARRMTRCPDSAMDVMQDAFMTAFKRMHQFRGDGSFGMWLRRVVATEALMYLRKQRRMFQLFAAAELGDQIGAEDASTMDLEHALGLLEEMPRAVMWLYHVEGYTHPEIAQMSGKSVSFSKSQLARAHQKLKRLMGDGDASKDSVPIAAPQEKNDAALFC